MLGAPSARLLQALAKPQLTDSDIQDYLDRLDEEAAPGRPQACNLSTAPVRAPLAPARNGGMTLTSRVQEIIVSEGRCTPRQCSLLAGGRVVLRVQGGPPQPFAIGRDVEDAVVTPAIPAGTSYEWTPPEPGRYFIRSEVYPSLRSEIRVLRPSDTAEAVGGASSSGGASSAFSRFGGSMSAVDEFVPFPALKAAGAGSYSRSTQTSGSSFGRLAGTFNPGPVLGRFQADSLGPDEEDSDDEGGGFVAPPGAGLRHRGRAAGAATQDQHQHQQQQAVSRHGALPQLGRAAPPAGLDGFSVISAGSGGSPRSGSGSEHSTGSAPLYVERRRVPGMLQSTYSAVHSGRSSYSDSRSGAGSEERQPLLYSVGGPAGYTASYGPGGLRAYPAAGAPPRMGAEEARTQKCPRCRKEYLSTINQRRCIASHLGASGGAKAARGVADPKQLAEFWDGLSEAERRSVMAVKEEHNGERTLRELSCQILHRKRPGATDGLTKEQRRLHLAGKMLHDFVTGELPPGGSQLVSVLSQVSEGTFLFERNAINRDEVLSGNNLEAGLGALVTKRLVGAHLAAKQAAAAAMQAQLEREQEDQEAQQAAKKSKQQQAGQQAGQAGAAKKQAKGSKAKAKPAAAAAKPASKPAPAGEAAAAAAEAAGSEAEAEAEQAAPAGRPPPLQLPANGNAAAQQSAANDGSLSPPSASGARYGASPLRPAGGASQYTNFLFLAEEAESTAADDEVGWRTAGSGRPSSRTSQHAAAKASGSSSGSQAASSSSKAAGRNGAAGAAAAAAAPGRPSSRAAERQAASGTASAPAAAPKAVAAANGKLAPPARSSTAAGTPSAAAAAPAGKSQQKQQPPPSRDDSFPALPAATGSKPRPAAASAAAPAAPPGFSYAAAASKVRKDGGKQQAGEGKQQAEQRPAQQQQQQAASSAQQPESWPVPGPVPGKGAKPSAPAPAATPAAAAQPAAAAAAPVVPVAQQQPAAKAAAAQKQPEPSSAPAAVPAAVPEAAPAAVPQPPVPAAEVQPAAAAEAPAAPAAAEAPEAGPGPAAAAAAEAQRCASVTPPISDAGSPPPGALPMPPGFAGPPGWVGPDGAPLMPPPLPPGYYWAAMPAMPGMQFGNVDMAEVLPAGPWPYPPFYPPGAPPPPFPLPPPGAMLPPGVPLPPHALPYGEEGMLAPFPPGMPVPLPPEAAEQLAAAAAAHSAAAAEEAGAAADAAAPAEPSAEEQEAGTDAAAGEAAGSQHTAADAASQPAATPRKGFLALLQDAYGPVGPVQQAAGAGRSQRGRGFDAAAAAAELERRWQAAAPTAVPAQRPQQAAAEAAPTAPRSASKARPPSRGSSSGSLAGSKSGKPSAQGSSSSGRASPAGGPNKPVVVAVRAWSSDDSASDGPKWKIQAAPQAQQGGAAATQQQQQQQ